MKFLNQALLQILLFIILSLVMIMTAMMLYIAATDNPVNPNTDRYDEVDYIYVFFTFIFINLCKSSFKCII